MNVVVTEVTVAVIEVLVEETEVPQEELIDLHLLADANSHQREKTVTTDDATETETTMSEDDQEVLSTVSEIVKETGTIAETTVIEETNVMNVMSEPTVTTAKVWTNLISVWKKSPADPYSAADSPVPAHDELDTAE